MSELQLYREAYDLLLWILNKTDGFPKSKRFSLGRRLEDACIDLVLACYRYPYAIQRSRVASSISRSFDEVKLLLHIAYDARIISQSSYAFTLERSERIGPMIGALAKSGEAGS